MSQARIRMAAALALAGLLAGGSSCSAMDAIHWGDLGGNARETPALEGAGTAASDAGRVDEGAAGEEEPPELGVGERLELAYPPVEAGRTGPGGPSRAVNGDGAAWPEMLYLGEEGRVGNVSIRPVEIRIVRGSSVPMAYAPQGDEMVPAPEGSPMWVRQQSGRGVLVIPPNASLVMVRIETTPSPGRWSSPGVYTCPENDATDYDYSAEDFRMAYPGLGEVPVQPAGDEFWFGEYQSVGSACPGSGWLYFIVADRDPAPSLLWLEHIRDAGPGGRAFWTLTERP